MAYYQRYICVYSITFVNRPLNNPDLVYTGVMTWSRNFLYIFFVSWTLIIRIN